MEEGVASFIREGKNREILLADLTAAEFALSDGTGRSTARAFRSLHDEITRSIFGREVGLFDRLAESVVEDVVDRWATLFRATIRDLWSRYPAKAGESFEFAGRDWVPVLRGSRRAISKLPRASRYAEFWAEHSFGSSRIRDSFERRLGFVASPEYSLLGTLADADALLVYDAKGLTVPSFDLVYELRSSDREIAIWRVLLALGWSAPTLPISTVNALETVRNGSHVRSELMARWRPATEVGEYLESRVDGLPLDLRLGLEGETVLVARDSTVRGVVVRLRRHGQGRLLVADDDEAVIALCRTLRADSHTQQLSFEPQHGPAVHFVFPNQRIVPTPSGQIARLAT